MELEDKYSVVFNERTSGYRKGFSTYLYNESGFLALKEGYTPVYCELLDLKGKELLIQAIFLCDGVKAISLPQAPFGGIHYHHVSIAILRHFVRAVVDYFTARHLQKIIIKNPAGIYNRGQNAIITNCLVNLGFTISNYDINHHIEVDQTGFSEKVHKMEDRKLRGAMKEKFGFREIAGKGIVEVYNFICGCRGEKKTNMNITFDQLNMAVKAFPENYKFFVVDFNGNIIAATVAVFVHKNILYNYLPASSVAYNKLSPMVFLLNGLYGYCQSKGVRIMDLGISSIDNKPQEGLVLFKERVGGKATLKLTFQRNLVQLKESGD